MRAFIVLYLIASTLEAQSLSSGTGSVFQTYKTTLGGVTNSSVFKKAFQDYNYIKSSRGIEVYETYASVNSANYNTRDNRSIFSKPEPSFIIRNNREIYRTYKSINDSTTNSSIFAGPMPVGVIEDKNINKFQKMYTVNNVKPKGLSYNPDIDLAPKGE